MLKVADALNVHTAVQECVDVCSAWGMGVGEDGWMGSGNVEHRIRAIFRAAWDKASKRW